MGISGGLPAVPGRAYDAGCEALQIFAANPSAWRSPAIITETAQRFAALTEELGISPVVVHTPYLLNLASPDPEISLKSRAGLSDSLIRASALGASYVVTHMGSHRGSGAESGVERICRSVDAVLEDSDPSVTLLLENSAGSGDSMGARFEEIRQILDCMAGWGDRVGICIDTAHAWGAGYDLSSTDAVEETIERFDALVGLNNLKVVHLNDTRVPLGSRRDRHANIGTGFIGEEGFSALVNHPALSHLAGIIETPPRPEGEERDLDILKRLRVV
jgi:deoxyribonuclease-4